MEPITSTVLAYLISLAAGVRTEAILKKQAEKRQQALAKIETTQQIQSFKDEQALVGEMQSLGHQLVANTKQIAELPDEAKALLDLFAEPDFLHDLARWLVMWDIEEGIKAQQALEFRMMVVLNTSGANPEYIDHIKTTYFALAAQEMSRNPVLANWRHQLALNALHQKVDQLHQLAKEQVGQYSPEQRQQAFDHYRELSLDICDILDLAGLPEDDRHLATQKFILRQFYVPLRLNVEMPREAEISIEQLEQLESRREKQRLYAAGRLPDDEQADDLQRVSVGERLTAAQRLVVLGDPGAGKTTLVRWLVTAYLLKMKADPDFAKLPDVAKLPDKEWLPILIRCRELDATCFTGTLDDILRQTLRKAQMTEQEADILLAVLREQLANGNALLLLDGLDEITEATTRARFCRQIESIAVAYPSTPIITTSRIVGYREMPFRLGRGFEHATVTELSTEDKDEFARRWCAATESQKSKEQQEKIAADLIKAIHSSDRIERLSGNPMLLTTLALVKRKVGKLPNRRADLYYEAVQVLLNWRSEVDEPIDKREAIPQLEYVAYEMCRRGVQRLREDEILELLDNVRYDYPYIRPLKKHGAEEFLRLLERRTSILVEVGTVRHNGQPVPVFEFRHLTFQEYLAGLALVDGRFPYRDKSLSLAERIAPLAGQIEKGKDVVSENWREALRLCISCCNDDDVDEAINAIVTPLDNEDAAITARPRAILAASCLADEPNVSEEMALDVLQKLVGHVQDNDDEYTSLYVVVRELARSEWAKYLQAMLVKEFCQCDAKTRIKFGGVCATIGGYAVPSESDLLAQWLDDAIIQLNSNNESKAVEKALAILEVAFQNSFDDKEKLSESMVSMPVPVLISMLDKTAHSAHAAAWALSWLSGGWRTSITAGIFSEEETLAQLLKFVSKPNFDKEATRWLITILGNANYSQAIEPLITKLNDDDVKVRKEAIEALGKIKDSRAVEALSTKLDDEDLQVKKAVIEVLGELKDSRAVEPLLAKLDDKRVASVVVKALGELKDSRAVEPLIPKLDDDNWQVVKAAIEALGKLKDSDAVEPLIAKLDDNDRSMKKAVIRALGNIQDSSAVEPLLAKLDDKRVASVVVKALGELKDSRAVEPLIAKLDDENLNIRKAVIGALGELKDSRAVEPLIAKLDDDDLDIRKAAIGALGDIQDSDAVEPLIAKLDDNDWNMRKAVIRALGNIQDSRAVEPLIAKLYDEYSDVRSEALGALAKICRDEVDQKLISEYFSNFGWFDPKEPINEERVAKAASKLKLTQEEVRQRYEDLARAFHLTLAWQVQES